MDVNEFKRKVKNWMLAYPEGSEQALIDFCEEAIPPSQFAAYQWLVEQTVGWYLQVVAHRKQQAIEDCD